MIGTILIIYGAINVLGWLAKPSIEVYYKERYGKSWASHSVSNPSMLMPPPDVYEIALFMWPAMPFIYGWFWFWDNVVPHVSKVIGYPGKLIAQRLSGTKKVPVLPPHTKDEFLSVAEKEVEEFLQKP